jgi:hypothetical protein
MGPRDWSQLATHCMQGLVLEKIEACLGMYWKARASIQFR